MVGFTGSPRRPRALVVELPDGRRAISQRLDPRTAAAAAARLRPAGSGSLARSTAGDPYTPVAPGLTVEAAAGTTRHAVVFPVKFFCSDLSAPGHPMQCIVTRQLWTRGTTTTNSTPSRESSVTQ